MFKDLDKFHKLYLSRDAELSQLDKKHRELKRKARDWYDQSQFSYKKRYEHSEKENRELRELIETLTWKPEPTAGWSPIPS